MKQRKRPRQISASIVCPYCRIWYATKRQTFGEFSDHRDVTGDLTILAAELTSALRVHAAKCPERKKAKA